MWVTVRLHGRIIGCGERYISRERPTVAPGNPSIVNGEELAEKSSTNVILARECRDTGTKDSPVETP